jgi:hypothetical protein
VKLFWFIVLTTIGMLTWYYLFDGPKEAWQASMAGIAILASMVLVGIFSVIWDATRKPKSYYNGNSGYKSDKDNDKEDEYERVTEPYETTSEFRLSRAVVEYWDKAIEADMGIEWMMTYTSQLQAGQEPLIAAYNAYTKWVDNN